MHMGSVLCPPLPHGSQSAGPRLSLQPVASFPLLSLACLEMWDLKGPLR